MTTTNHESKRVLLQTKSENNVTLVIYINLLTLQSIYNYDILTVILQLIYYTYQIQ